MGNNLFFIPLGGSGGGSGDLSNYYTKSQVDTLIQDFITSSVNDLVNYYTKTETYTQDEINTLIGSIESIHFEFAASTSDVQDPQGNLIYLIGPSGTGADQYEEYVYANNQWTKIGDTSIDLSGYATTTDLQNAINLAMTTLQNALENYYNKSEVDEMIAQVQTLQGIQGIKGADGMNGVDGLQGVQGLQGEQGVQGLQGEHGLQGIQGIQGPAGGGGSGGGNAWYGSQAQFDALESKDTNTDYFISDKLDYNTDLKNTPDLSELATKSELNKEATALDGKKENKIKYMTMQGFQSIQPQEGHVYAIEGNTVEMVFTFTDNTQATYNVVVD